MIRICCNSYEAENKSTEWVTSGMIGAVCEFSFDSAWDGLYKTAVFRAGNTVRDVVLTENRCVIPWEVLTEPELALEVGVYGTNAGGTLVIPTVYANCGKIHPGADPSGEGSYDPTLPVWAQLQAQIGDLDELETSAKDTLIDAINEAAQSGGHTGGSGSGSSGESSTIDVHTQALSPTSAHENGGTQVDFDVETGGAISRTSVQLWNGNDGGGGGSASSAGDVSVSDAGEYFTAGTVEGALQEIGAELSGISASVIQVTKVGDSSYEFPNKTGGIPIDPIVIKYGKLVIINCVIRAVATDNNRWHTMITGLPLPFTDKEIICVWNKRNEASIKPLRGKIDGSSFVVAGGEATATTANLQECYDCTYIYIAEGN